MPPKVQILRTDPLILTKDRPLDLDESTHPYGEAWWPPGHLVGYEHTFINAIADFIRAVADGKSVQPTFADGLANQRVLDAVAESANERRWVKI